MRKASSLFIATTLVTASYANIYADGGPAIDEPTQTKIVTQQPKAFTGKVTKNKVRLRTQPNLEGAVVREMDQGDMLVVVGEEDGFYAVLPPPQSKAYVYRTYVLDGTIEGNRVNVRLNPNTEAPVIGQLNAGDKIDGTLSTENNKWYEVTPPQNTRFYIATDFVEKVGSAQYFVQYHEKLNTINELLTSTQTLSQQELAKPFNEMQPELVTENYKKIINFYPEFPEHVSQAKNALTQFEDTYLHKKVDYLESKTKSYNQAIGKSSREYNQEMEEQKSKLAVLEKELKEAHQTKNAGQAYQRWVEEKYASEVNTRMSLWIPVELALYEQWTKDNEEKSVEDFYTEQKNQSLALRGIIETYDRPVKNKPGDYLLVNRSNHLPIAYIYSTQVNLNDKLGQEVTIQVASRPNNNYAYPAYFVLSAE